MSEFLFRRIGPEFFPGVDVDAISNWEAALRSLELRRGSAWVDTEFGRELSALHERLAAPRASRENLQRLLAGEASCVITGQQPGLLGGPLYGVYKAAGAVGLARALSARSGEAVIPVFWCGADDSDFDEARTAWLWQQERGAVRVELPGQLLASGNRVGSLLHAEVDVRERRALEYATGGSAVSAGFLDSLDGRLDFGQRHCARMLSALGGAGLVVLDARSPRLRQLGRPLFAGYAERVEQLSESLLRRRRELLEAGRAVPISEAALRSALFLLEGERRTKLSEEELPRFAADRRVELTPSVTLRPVWQDELMAPVASILGPTELAYHAQLTPIYEALGVAAALPLPRPHVAQLPAGLWEELGLNEYSPRLSRLFHGQAEALAILRAAALDGGADARFAELESAIGRAFERVLGARQAPSDNALWAGRERVRQELERMRAEWGDTALDSRVSGGMPWRLLPSFLHLRGKFQERALAIGAVFTMQGKGWTEWLEALAAAAGESYVEGLPPCYVSDCALDSP